MGLFDGQIGGDGFASTAHVAGLLDAPVVLVLDISLGLPDRRRARARADDLRPGRPAQRRRPQQGRLGPAQPTRSSRRWRPPASRCSACCPATPASRRPSRHLGLVPAAERGDAAAAIARLADQVAEHLDLDPHPGAGPRRTAAGRRGLGPRRRSWPRAQRAARPVVAVAGGRAFTFRYAETDELLRAAGCEPVPFDPLTDDRAARRAPPGSTWAAASPRCTRPSSAPTPRCGTSLRTAVAAGLPTVAECAGLLYLCRTVDGSPMVGAIDADGRDDAEAHAALPHPGRRPGTRCWPPAGTRVTGHEFHRTHVDPAGRRRRGLAGRRPAASASPPTPPAAARPACTPPTCTCTGPATRSWPSASPTPCTPRPPIRPTCPTLRVPWRPSF